MTDAPESTPAPTVGQSVLSADGQVIGHVKEVRGAYFHVDVHHGSDWWVSFDAPREWSPDIVLPAAFEDCDQFNVGEPPSPEEVAWANAAPEDRTENS